LSFSLAGQALAIIVEGDDRRGRTCAFGIFNDLRVLAVHDGYAGIGRPEVDTDYFSHVILSLKRTAGTHSGIQLAAPNGMVFSKA
jgi:hypothetical protein